MNQTPPTRGPIRLAAIASCVGLVIALAACGATEDAATDDGPVTVMVSLTPSAAAAAFYLGIEKGFFDDEGLTVEMLETGQGAVTGIPSLLSGESDFTSGSYDAAVVALAQGLGIRSVAPFDVAPDDPDDDMYRLIAAAGSSISSPCDLEGKTVGVNSVGGLPVFQTNAAIAASGCDPSTVTYVAVPYAQGLTALEQGQVDAVHSVEPFLTSFQTQVEIADVGPAAYPLGANAPVVGWLTSTAFYDENPDVVARFQRAVNASNAYAAAHPDEARATVTTIIDLPADVIEQMRMPTFVEQVSVEQVAEQQELILTHDPDVEGAPPAADEWVLDNPLDTP